MTENYAEFTPEQKSLVGRLLRFCLTNKLVVGLIVLFVIALGIYVAPFDWNLGGLPRNPVPTDAIPDIGENQQIVFTEWMGRSPFSYCCCKLVCRSDFISVNPLTYA